MTREGTVDERERGLLDRALRELGYEPADFTVEIAAVAPMPGHRTTPTVVVTILQRKEVVVTRISSGDTFRQEQLVEGAWAGEVLQALMHGFLGPQPSE